MRHGQPYPPTEWFRKRGLILHKGVDLAPVDLGVYHVIAPVRGMIYRAEFNPSYGNMIVIEFIANALREFHLLGHLESFVVKIGNYIEKGEAVGIMGSTGQSTAKHLHMEIQELDYFGKVLIWKNPEPYLT